MVLSLAQVHALYMAMIALNEINASYRFTVEDGSGSRFIIEEEPDSWAVLVRINDGTIINRYENQAAFALAYGMEV
jgi:hypothetical protein